MKEIWNTIKVLFGWLIGVSSVLAGITSFVVTYGVMPKVFGGILVLVGLYIIPKIYNFLNLGIRIKHIVIAYLVGLIGFAFTIDSKPPKPVDKNTFFITANTLNIRKGEGENHKVLYKLKKGDAISLTEKGESWSKISTSQGEGFASSKYISNNNPNDSAQDDWMTYLIIGGIVVFGLFSKSGKSNSDGSYKPRSSSTPKQSAIPKPEAPTHICKYCGSKNKDMWQLTRGNCRDSPTKKHQPFEGGIRPDYICKYCGIKNRDLWQLTRGNCRDSLTNKHQPFVGGIQSDYLCKYCGIKNRNLWQLTRGNCRDSPTKKHQPFDG